MVRALHKVIVRRNRDTLHRFLQLCCTPAGSHKLVHSVRMLLEDHRD
jgi:uncharacterized membrane protein